MLSLCIRLAVLATLVLSGCTHHRPLDTTSPENQTLVNTRAEGEVVHVTLHSGEETPVRGLHVAPDVTTWIDPDTGEMHSAPTSDIASVRFTNRGRGIVEGLGAGAAVGAGLGIVVGGITGANDDGDFIQFTPAGGAFFGALVFGGVGAVIGGLAGLDQGSRTVYELPTATHDD